MTIIQTIISFVMLLIGFFIYSIGKKHLEENKTIVDKFNQQKTYAQNLLKWHKMRSAKKNLAEFFKEKGIGSISIYGAGDIGKILADELKDHININYLIDKNTALIGELYSDVPIVLPLKRNDFGEAIVIAVMRDFDQNIKSELGAMGLDIALFTLNDIVSCLLVENEIDKRK